MGGKATEIDQIHTSFHSVGLFFAHNLVILPLELATRIGYLNPELLPHTKIIHVDFDERRMAIYDLLVDNDYYNSLRRHIRWQRVNFDRVATCMHNLLSGNETQKYNNPANFEEDRAFYRFLLIEALPQGVVGTQLETLDD